MSSPIIIFNPEGLNKEQVKLIKQALDDAYRAGYETAKEFYQLKPNTLPAQNQGHTWITAPMPNTHGVEQGIYPTSSNEGLPGPTVSKGRGR